MDQFVQAYPKFSTPPNLIFLTWRTEKFKLYIFLSHTFSTQIEPKPPQKIWIDPHLDYKTGVHIHLVDAVFRWFVSVALFRSLKNWANYNSATSSNHLKTICKRWKLNLTFFASMSGIYISPKKENSHNAIEDSSTSPNEILCKTSPLVRGIPAGHSRRVSKKTSVLVTSGNRFDAKCWTKNMFKKFKLFCALSVMRQLRWEDCGQKHLVFPHTYCYLWSI